MDRDSRPSTDEPTTRDADETAAGDSPPFDQTLERSELAPRVTETELGRWPPLAYLTVTQTVAQHLRALEARGYEFAEFATLRATLRSTSAPICSYLRGIGRRDVAAERAYFHRPGPFIYGGLSSKYGAISGCWNYVRMNDRRPDRELALLRQLFPADRYECVSVGVMQPYLLNDRLPCRSLSIVDFDWRVHDLHAQMIELASLGEITDLDGLAPGLASLTTSWLALRETTTAEQSVAIDDLCSETMRESCEQALLSFLRLDAAQTVAGIPIDATHSSEPPPRTLEEIHLLLASLHDAEYRQGPMDARFVFYFSNALEPMYTSAGESRQLRDRLATLLVDGRRAVLIHHAGGREEFGIYEAWNDGSGLELRTLCKDPYPETRKGHNSTHYSIELDRVASPGPSCKSMLREGFVGPISTP